MCPTRQYMKKFADEFSTMRKWDIGSSFMAQGAGRQRLYDGGWHPMTYDEMMEISTSMCQIYNGLLFFYQVNVRELVHVQGDASGVANEEHRK